RGGQQEPQTHPDRARRGLRFRQTTRLTMAFGQRLYLRIWLAVVAAVTVVTLVVGWLWQQTLESDRAEREARVTRTILIENAAGDVLGDAPARAERIPGVGWRFEVVMKDGEKLYVLLPRSNN